MFKAYSELNFKNLIMHSLFIEKIVLSKLRKVTQESVKLFGYCEPRKSENLLKFAEITTTFNGLYGSMTVFFDLIAGHHECLKSKEEQDCFVEISKKLSEMPGIYNKLPFFRSHFLGRFEQNILNIYEFLGKF